jgi:hypothetical protein
MPDKKDIKKLVNEAQHWPGWRVVEVTKGWMIYPPDKSLPPINVHRTPSDHRAWQNTISRLRRAGAPV